MPRLVLICGMPGAGKTTLARRMATERRLVRLCPDEWLAGLGLDLEDEKRLWARRHGVEVELTVLDVPLEERWRRIPRRNAAPEAGHVVLTHADLEHYLQFLEPPGEDELALFDRPPADRRRPDWSGPHVNRWLRNLWTGLGNLWTDRPEPVEQPEEIAVERNRGR